MTIYKKIKYENCPLIEVTFQINFPTILSIDAAEPFSFQEEIRSKYPIYTPQTVQNNEIQVSVENEIANAVINQQYIRKLYHFLSKDQQWRVTLSKDMLAISTVKYDTWEDLREKAIEVINLFVKMYNPAFITRIGLRYIDALERSKLGLLDTPWCELVKPHLCGSLSYKSESNVNVRKSNVTAELSYDNVIVNYTSGLGTVNHHNGEAPSEAFILNCDYYVFDKFDISDLNDLAEKLHERSHIFFGESITEKLHKAMRPIEKDNV